MRHTVWKRVEDDSGDGATDPKDVVRFVKEIPTGRLKARQEISADVSDLYAPEYIEHGKSFEGVQRTP